ncbi:MAG: divalent metal cation transporter [Candidatus Micrarchaeia archaeon]
MLLILPLYIIQEASGRIGAVTRQGLGDTIRGHYSKATASLMVIPMFFADIATYVAEFLGIGVGLEILGIPLYAGIIAAYIIFLVVAFTREYESAERILVAVSALLVLGLFATLLLRGVKPYPVFVAKPSSQYLFLASATIGAVVMPFMLFFQASATGQRLEKGESTLTKESCGK